MFKDIMQRINQNFRSLGESTSSIGILDLPAPENLEKNGLVQLLMNYTQECVQQFYLHHVFSLEKTGRAKDLDEIDFGNDLQPVIDVISKSISPKGILTLLDESCRKPFPSKEEFSEILETNWSGKSPKFKSVPQGFILEHYVGEVCYTAVGWACKNRDLISDILCNYMSRSSVPYLATLFRDYAQNNGNIAKSTVQNHKDSVELFLKQIKSTQPHFVKCINPNKEQKEKLIDGKYVLDQLRHAGVVEVVRLCKEDFVDQLGFSEFFQRYEKQLKDKFPGGRIDNYEAFMKSLNIKQDGYRIGKSKIFFWPGVLSQLDGILSEGSGMQQSISIKPTKTELKSPGNMNPKPEANNSVANTEWQTKPQTPSSSC